MTDSDRNDSDRGNPDIYQISGLSKPPETTFVPSNNSDIFAIKKENIGRLDAIIAMALSEGVFLCNAYRLDRRISRDEMGEIWKAADLRASRNVIIYLPPSEIRKDEATIEPVRQAAKHVEALEHPRIVPVLQNFTDPEHGFFTVRKFVSGKTLDTYWQEYVRQHKKTVPNKVMTMLSDIAHALDYAHGVDIVHGDLSPKNIIVDLNGDVYIDNFALLPVRAENASAMRKPYLAPEVIEGNAATASSDIYSFAVVAYELFSGRLPFSTEHNVPLPIPGVPSDVDAIILKALSKDPDDRYDSCGAFVKALEASFRKKIKAAAKTKPVATVPKPKLPGGKKRSTSLLLGMILAWLLLIGGAVAYFVGNGENVQTLLAMLGIDNHLPIEKREDVPVVPTEPMEEDIFVRHSGAQDLASGNVPGCEPPNPTVAPQGEDIEVSTSCSAEVTDVTEHQPSGLCPGACPMLLQGDENQHEHDADEESGESADQIEAEHSLEEQVVASSFTSATADPAREEGEEKNITIRGVKYRFRWCRFAESSMFEGYWIQETAVTQEFWRNVMGVMSIPQQHISITPHRTPVTNVTWSDCHQLIERLNESDVLENSGLEEYHFAMPTDAQWQYAYNRGFLVVREDVFEWCRDWFDDDRRHRVIRGSNSYFNGRSPGRYANVGLRLVIIPGI